MAYSLRRRLVQDIEELQREPYPKVSLQVQDGDLTKACLNLTADAYGPIHITVKFPSEYPLCAPSMRMDSRIHHPNVFSSGYICASILNTDEGYTSAYTLKGICIQLLSFFSSDTVEQMHGGASVSLKSFKEKHALVEDPFKCEACGFSKPIPAFRLDRNDKLIPGYSGIFSALPEDAENDEDMFAEDDAAMSEASSTVTMEEESTIKGPIQDDRVSNEVLLEICKKLEIEDLMRLAQAWDRIGKVITDFDVIRTRELQCFCLKKDYQSVKLGVGVSVHRKGSSGSFTSEFDLLSSEGFHIHNIRRSVQGLSFNAWLALPISEGHWRRVRGDAIDNLRTLAAEAELPNAAPSTIIFSFMNSIVIRLNEQTQPNGREISPYPVESTQSSLTHASEKAIESYFHLFHLLLCLATEDSKIVDDADWLLDNFGKGRTLKDECPNLGSLLVAALISTVEMTEPLINQIIKEAVTRNVVWLLEESPELSYLEPSDVSEYRLRKTFAGSITSYRLLMFLYLFRKTAVGSPRKPLTQLRDETFTRHGAPPRGAAKELADSIKRIHLVDNFSDFFKMMGIKQAPSKVWISTFLKDCVQRSMNIGYSKMPISQSQALSLRISKEPRVAFVPGVGRLYYPGMTYGLTFFPTRGGGASRGRGRGGPGDNGYRGRGRGQIGRGTASRGRVFRGARGRYH